MSPTFETATDWDSAQSETGTRHPSGSLEKGYPKSSTDWSNWTIPQPVTYWSADDGSGSTLTEHIGSNDGTLNGPSWQTGGVLNTPYLSYDGTDDFVSVPDAAAMDFQGALTFAAWINPVSVNNTKNNGHRVLSKYDTANDERQYEFRIGSGSSGDVILVYANSDGSGFDFTQSNGNDVATNTWQLVSVTWAKDENSGYPKLFVNGSEVSDYSDQTARTTDINDNSIDLHIGKSAYASDSEFDGAIGELMQWDTRLTDAQISDLYQAAI